MTTTTTPRRTPPPGTPPPHMPPPVPGTGLRTAAATPRPSGRSGLWTGVIAGPIAVGVAALLQMLAAGLDGDQVLRPLRMMTVPLLGGGGLTGGNPLLGVMVNVVVGLAIGVGFAAVVPRLSGSRSILIGALVLGAGVFAVDYLFLGPLLSDVLTLRDPVITLASRLIFGAVLAVPFLGNRRGPAAS